MVQPNSRYVRLSKTQVGVVKHFGILLDSVYPSRRLLCDRFCRRRHILAIKVVQLSRLWERSAGSQEMEWRQPNQFVPLVLLEDDGQSSRQFL